MKVLEVLISIEIVLNLLLEVMIMVRLTWTTGTVLP